MLLTDTASHGRGAQTLTSESESAFGLSNAKTPWLRESFAPLAPAQDAFPAGRAASAHFPPAISDNIALQQGRSTPRSAGKARSGWQENPVGNACVLVVEDEPLIRDLIVAKLCEASYIVVAAGNAL